MPPSSCVNPACSLVVVVANRIVGGEVREKGAVNQENLRSFSKREGARGGWEKATPEAHTQKGLACENVVVVEALLSRRSGPAGG